MRAKLWRRFDLFDGLTRDIMDLTRTEDRGPSPYAGIPFIGQEFAIPYFLGRDVEAHAVHRIVHRQRTVLWICPTWTISPSKVFDALHGAVPEIACGFS